MSSSSQELHNDLCADGALPVLNSNAEGENLHGTIHNMAIPASLRDHLYFIEAALSWYDGGPAHADVKFAWKAILSAIADGAPTRQDGLANAGPGMTSNSESPDQ